MTKHSPSLRTIVRHVGLVGAHLLGGDDEVEVVRDVAPRLAQELVVDVRDEARLQVLDGLVELGVGLAKRRPALDAVGQEARAGGLQRPVQALGDLDRRASQHLGVQLVGPALDLALDLVEVRDELLPVDREAVARGLLLERVEDPGLPVDEGAVDIEGDERDLLGKRHDGGDDRSFVVLPAARAGIRAPSRGDGVGARLSTIVRSLMDLLEYKGKIVLARYGVPLFPGKAASTPDEAAAAAEEIGGEVVVKAQVKIGGRGKAGGIKLAANPEETRAYATDILGMDIRGHTVHELWIQQATDIASEYYAAVVFDRSAKAPLVMLSTQGGMDIEQVAAEHPDALAMLHVDPLVGFQPFHGRRLAFEAGVEADVVRQVGDLLAKLYEVFCKEDATLIEINPMVVTPARKVMASSSTVTSGSSATGRA